MNRGFTQMQAETSSFYSSAPETQVSIAECWRGYARELLTR